MNNTQRAEYWDTINSIVNEAIEESKDQELDITDYIHESVDGSEYIIYYHKNIEVLQYTDNDEALFDNEGSATFDSTVSTLQRIAYWAMLQDCMDALSEQDIDY